MDVYNCYLSEGPDADKLTDFGYKYPTAIEDEIKLLFRAFSADLLYGKRHYAPCSAWRSEQVLLGQSELPRFARRLHVFEKSNSQSSAVTRYLGYVSLRPFDRPPKNYLQYVTVAHITMPRYMLRPRYHTITCVGGPSENVLPFRCVPFCFPLNDIRLRAACLHATLYAGMLLKMNSYHYIPVSSQEMISLLWKINDGSRTINSLAKEGASLTDALNVLRHEKTQAGGVLERITLLKHLNVSEEDADDYDFIQRPFTEVPEAEKGKYTEICQRFGRTYEDQVNHLKLEAHRCMTEYLANGMPLVLEVDLAPAPDQSSRAHSILVFGMHLLHDPEEVSYLRKLYCATDNRRRVDFAELPGRFVTHDINHGPFAEYSAHNLLKRMWCDDENFLLSGISFLALAPAKTEIGIGIVREAASEKVRDKIRAEPEFWKDYSSTFFEKEGPEEWNVGDFNDFNDVRCVTRLMKSAQVEKRYFPVEEYDKERVTQKDDQVKAALHAWQRCVAKYDEDRWWVVEIRMPYYASAKEPDDDKPSEAPPALVYFWSSQGKSPMDGSLGDVPEPCAIIEYIGATAEHSRDTVAFADTGEEADFKYELRTQRT